MAKVVSHGRLQAQAYRITGSRVRQGVGVGLLHLVGDVRLVLLEDGQRVSLGVEHPVVERQVVVVGEEQVEIPGGDREGRGYREEMYPLTQHVHCRRQSSMCTWTRPQNLLFKCVPTTTKIPWERKNLG